MFEGGRYKIPAGRFPTDRHDRRVITEDTSWDTFVSHSVTHFFAHFAETATVWGQGRRHFAETEIAGMGTGSGTFLCRQNSAGVEVSHMVSVSADPPVQGGPRIRTPCVTLRLLRYFACTKMSPILSPSLRFRSLQNVSDPVPIPWRSLQNVQKSVSQSATQKCPTTCPP